MAGRGTDIVLGGNPDMMLRARGLDPHDPANADELARREQQGASEQRGLHHPGNPGQVLDLVKDHACSSSSGTRSTFKFSWISST